MIAPKSTLTLVLASLLAVATIMTISCSDESSHTEDAKIVNPTDGMDTLKMDTAVTRPPVKTTN